MSEKPKYWPISGDPKAAVALLQREGVWHISGYDGCLCARLSIMCFDIIVSCRKSGGGGHGNTLIGVSSSIMGAQESDLEMVAAEVRRQILEQEPQAKIVLGIGLR